jgi:hypothetical protein
MLNDEVKRQLSIAYAELSALQNKLTVSPAHPNVADICQLTSRLKEYCSVHVHREVTQMENTHAHTMTHGPGGWGAGPRELGDRGGPCKVRWVRWPHASHLFPDEELPIPDGEAPLQGTSST